MNKFVKLKGWSNWTLVVDKDFEDIDELSVQKSEEILRKLVVELHTPSVKLDAWRRIILVATRKLDYENLVEKYGTLYVQEHGSFCIPHEELEIVDEIYSTHFPINDFADILICENDASCNFEWKEYLKETYPDMSIKTIPFFDICDETKVKEYFDNAKLITFSTTFSDLEWFKKLKRNLNKNHKVVGHCVMDNFDYTEVNKILSTVNFIKNLKMHDKEIYKFKI